jgi:hypothetical protein
MPSHCNAIVRNQEAIAAECDAMAAGHRQTAEQPNLEHDVIGLV